MIHDGATESDLICAVDLGGTNLRAANIDGKGHIHERVRNCTPQSNKPEAVVSLVAAVVRECETAAAKRGAHIQSVSIVVPGTVHIETGLVVNAPNLNSLQGYNLGPALECALNRSVLLENDANAAALGERPRDSAAAGSESCRSSGSRRVGTLSQYGRKSQQRESDRGPATFDSSRNRRGEAMDL